MYEFLLGLAVVAVFIFLLNILQHGISTTISSHADAQRDTANGSASVAAAIHAYRHLRQVEERNRATREWVTIIVLAVTAVFAFLAAGAAGVSAWIFSGQLGEMHHASIDTADLVKTARETEERQLRAYLSIVGDIHIRCYSCNYDKFGPLSLAPQYILDNTITYNIQNGGQTPAYNAYIEDSYYYTSYEGQLPKNFTYPMIKGTDHFAGVSPSAEYSIGMFNSHETAPSPSPLQQSVVDLIGQARRHSITLFYYGDIRYTDIFQKPRITPFCFQYLPDLPSDEQFANCEEHNTPPKDG
jgi:Na+-transporting methylmalonyl-CoA/oxaloacetate decarboxylase gamma subunit